MFFYILIAVVAVIVLFVIIVSTRPSRSLIIRKTSITAPPAIIFDQVNDLHKWQAWSPWAKMDPAAKNAFTGAGSSMSWSGNNKVGEGRMTITDSRPNEFIRFKLEFFKPFRATNTAEFTFQPEGNQTLVTWSMSGECNFVMKAVSLFMDCDKLVGGQFETGLADIKSICEVLAKNNP